MDSTLIPTSAATPEALDAGNRQAALIMAMRSHAHGATPEKIVETATVFYNFLVGKNG